MKRRLWSLVAAVPLLGAACGSIPTKSFEFDAIDSELQQAVPCLVVIDDDWDDAERKKRFVNVGSDGTLKLSIPFERPVVDVTVAAVGLHPESGEPLNVPHSRESSHGYHAEPRRLRIDDPTFQLFILRLKR
jgi:hypothetical protein